MIRTEVRSQKAVSRFGHVVQGNALVILEPVLLN
jgi:peptide methionine sulfoxide reductase MsrB